MGHGAELVFSGVFLYRALAGVSLKTPMERPVYAFAGFYLQLSALGFAYSLLTDKTTLQQYLAGKGGIDNDFIRIGRDYLGVDVTTVAAFFMICAIVPPFAAWWYWRFNDKTP